MLDPARQNQMAVKPGTSGSYDGKRHSHLKGNPRFFRKYYDRPNFTNGREKLVVEPPDRIRPAAKVGRDSMPAARVRLIAIREVASTRSAAPHRMTVLPLNGAHLVSVSEEPRRAYC